MIRHKIDESHSMEPDNIFNYKVIRENAKNEKQKQVYRIIKLEETKMPYKSHKHVPTYSHN